MTGKYNAADDVGQSTNGPNSEWSVLAYMPVTLSEYATDASLKRDVVLSYEPISTQVLLGVWRN
jgi:hypothetical protein